MARGKRPQQVAASKKEVRWQGFVLSTVAGTCAGLASVFGKLAVDGVWVQRFIDQICGAFSTSTSTSTAGLMVEEYAGPALRAGCFGMIIVCNMVMWNLFVKSMNLSSSVTATVVNSATNFFSSALLGHLLFSEPLPAAWWIGSAFIVAGLFFLARGDTTTSSSSADTASRRAKAE
jgi:drug/metabolite transporter (DMT)-like permease